ncbi:uncharacterized protein ACR2FA_012834 [Aphomia sociella]
MESTATDDPLCQPSHIENKNAKEHDSAENFQKFIYELFEKNGVLNDLRAYLRGHIVDVLNSAQTGDPPPCQKHFTQRLELTYQALNILVAEYLLRLEFSYSLSVFVSEIPLANMVFEFAKTLLQNADDANSALRFTDGDVWSILNYLGIKCDSEHAYNVVEMYNSKENLPLLLCILKCMPMYKETINVEPDISSLDSMSSVKSSETLDEKTKKNGSWRDKCKHYVFCKTCQNRMSHMKDKYMTKTKKMAKTIKETQINPLNVEEFMKNISITEKGLVDEMFQQLKNVYEAEVEMVKVEEEKKTKRSLAKHVTQLQRHRDEMEETFKARESELEKNVEQKKRFLWGLARQLRSQHSQLARAMLALRGEAERLSAKEDSLKTQLLDAETILKKRGEEMRMQISNELVILEGHLESMKKERDSINRERTELQNYKTHPDPPLKNSIENEDLKSHYDLLKNELAILKKYLETTKMEPKCVIERATITDLNGVNSKINIVLNNEEADRITLRSDSEERIRAPNQVVNDLKKQKNVNFSQFNLDEVYRQRSRDRSRSSASSEAGDAAERDRDYDCNRGRDYNHVPDYNARCDHVSCDIVQHLRDENDSLKDFAKQQRTHIDDLTSQQARLQAELTAVRSRADAARPRTAPAFMPRYSCLPERLNMSASANTFGWRKGAGEELSVFSEARPRVLLPGDALPFLGVLRDARDGRRHLINQWRALRRSSMSSTRRPPSVAMRPPSAKSATYDMSAKAPPPHLGPPRHQTGNDPTVGVDPTDRINPHCQDDAELAEGSSENIPYPAMGCKDIKRIDPNKTREKSPNSVLREAKLRLRKLEIEAEAVEKSYLDFRKRQTERREDRMNYEEKDNSLLKDVGDLGIKRSKSLHKIENDYRFKVENTHNNYNEATMKTYFDKYLCEYRPKFNINETYPKKSNFIEKVHPVPDAFSKIEKNEGNEKHNYLETPLIEFRKFYHSEKLRRPLIITDNTRSVSPINIEKNEHNIIEDEDTRQGGTETRNEIIRKVKNDKVAQLKILKENITKIYNLPKQCDVKPPSTEYNIDNSSTKFDDVIEERDENLLRIEVENVRETNNLKLSNPQPQEVSLVVQSTIDAREGSLSEGEENEKKSTQMTIIVSPKSNSPRGPNPIKPELTRSSPNISKCISLEEAARLTRNDVKPQPQEVSLVVQSTIDAREGSLSEVEENEKKSTQLTIIVSPKSNSPRGPNRISPELTRRSPNISESISLEEAARRTRNDVKPHPQEVSLVVQSTIDAREGSLSEVEENKKQSTQMAIIVSPKLDSPRGPNAISPELTRSPNISERISPEEAAHLTRNDVLDAIFHADLTNQMSSTEMQPDASKDVLEDSISEFEKGEDYVDDLSVDIDNYNSRSENNSPISLPKTSEEENFWDS